MPTTNSLYLCGMMGAGKSTVGKIIASELNLHFVDLDIYIEKNEGQSIASIFESRGEAYFRHCEEKYFFKLVKNSPCVMALGGGTLQVDSIFSYLKNKNLIYLKANIQTLVLRLREQKMHRPLIAHTKSLDELKKLIEEKLEIRKPLYEASKFVIEIDQLNASQVVDKVREQIC